MLIFYRPSFKSGVMLIEDRDSEGKVFKQYVKPHQNGGEFYVKDEAYVKQKYPKFFFTPDEYEGKKREDRKRREKKEYVQS